MPRIGIRKLDRLLDRRFDRRLDYFTTRTLGGASRSRSPNDLAIAIRCLSEAIRIHKRMAKREPHLFDYATIDRDRREAAARQQREAECQAALERVYGTPLEDLLAGKTQNGAKTVQK